MMYLNDNVRIMYHPNQESKKGNATYGSFTKKNFSDNEALPGKRVHMEIVRDKISMVEQIRKGIKTCIQKMGLK